MGVFRSSVRTVETLKKRRRLGLLAARRGMSLCSLAGNQIQMIFKHGYLFADTPL